MLWYFGQLQVERVWPDGWSVTCSGGVVYGQIDRVEREDVLAEVGQYGGWGEEKRGGVVE